MVLQKFRLENKLARRVLIHWVRFGPYHIARFQAAREYFWEKGMELVGLQIAQTHRVYSWRESSGLDKLGIYTLFRDRAYENIRYAELGKTLAAFIRRVFPDVAIISGYRSKDSLLLLTICKWFGIPIILMSETKADDFPRKKLVENLKKHIIGNFSSAICGGTLHRDYLISLGMPADRIFLGYDVVDNHYFASQAEQARRTPCEYKHLPGLDHVTPFFLASLRFIKRKNIERLVIAYQIYREKIASLRDHTPWRMVILGDGEERGTIETLIQKMDIQGITLAGFHQIEDIPVYYGLAKAFIHPALREQWGLVVNEAMASGLPVVVSRVCGCVPELVEHGVNGYTFNPEDPAELAEYLLLLSSDPKMLERMGAASRDKISNWGLDRFAKSLFCAVSAALENSSLTSSL